MPKALKIANVNGGWYYVEVRTRLGYDSGIAPGVLVHAGDGADPDSSLELDLDPVTSAFDALLDIGQTFTDAASGLTLTVVSSGPTGATVNVVSSGPPCTARAPIVSFSPAGPVVTSPSQSVTYSLSVRNADDASCAAATFALSAGVPAGWTTSFDRLSLVLAPGATGTAGLTVTPSATASGTTTVSATAARVGGTGPGGAATTSIAIAGSLDLALSFEPARNGEALEASVMAGGAPAAGATVTFVVRNPKGVLTTISATTGAAGSAAATLHLKPKDPKGPYQVQATATAGALSGTASGGFTW